MDRKTILDTAFPECPIRNILARIGDKWSLLVIYTLDRPEPMRFGELLREIPDISQKMLTVTLRTLVEDDLATRTIYAEIPPRTEYRLTDRARTLLPHIESLIGWAMDNSDGIFASRAERARKSSARQTTAPHDTEYAEK